MRFVLTGAFLFCSVREATALQRPNVQDVRDVAFHISMATAAEASILKNTRDRNGATDEELADLDIDLSRLEDERKISYEQAMWLTLRAYGIITFDGNEPRLPSGVSWLQSPEKGTPITWLPVFEDIGVKPAQNARGERGVPPRTKEFFPRNAGNTASDGISRIFPGAFGSPVELASYLIHEIRHFVQNTSRGEGDVKTTAELEVEAYELELDLLNDPGNILGYSDEIKESQLGRLTELLDGDNKNNIGFRKKAKIERAEADKFRHGRPLPEPSLISHSKIEIGELIQQARDQIVIAQRDHDERLKGRWAALAKQSCANPGSVTQANLDALPFPHRRDLAGDEPPSELGFTGCLPKLYVMISQGWNPESLARESQSWVPVNPFQPTPIAPLPTTPTSGPNPSGFGPGVLVELKQFSVTACHATDEAQVVQLYSPHYDWAYEKADDIVARNLSSGLDECPRKLFYRLIFLIREGHYTGDWIREAVAAYAPRRGAAPGQVNPPSGGTPPAGGTPPSGCRVGDDPFGCQRKHPHIVIPKAAPRPKGGH